MNKPASIFLTNVTVIDGAFVTERGMVEGASFNPKFVVTGPVTEDEQVVIDFGRIKKKLKEWIDNPQSSPSALDRTLKADEQSWRKETRSLLLY